MGRCKNAVIDYDCKSSVCRVTRLSENLDYLTPDNRRRRQQSPSPARIPLLPWIYPRISHDYGKYFPTNHPDHQGRRTGGLGIHRHQARSCVAANKQPPPPAESFGNLRASVCGSLSEMVLNFFGSNAWQLVKDSLLQPHPPLQDCDAHQASCLHWVMDREVLLSVGDSGGPPAPVGCHDGHVGRARYVSKSSPEINRPTEPEHNNFAGVHAGSFREPDFCFVPRRDGRHPEFPSVVIESGWWESGQKLKEDREIWQAGSGPRFVWSSKQNFLDPIFRRRSALLWRSGAPSRVAQLSAK